jgi:hypothetical protein
VAGSYLFGSLADLCPKKSVKLVAIVKMKVYNRILATSALSELVGNELTV